MSFSPLSLAKAPIAEVVELARGNGMVDRDLAWAELCVRSRNTVRSKVARILQYGDMDAVVQDTFLTAFVHIGRLRDNTAFVPWIRSIATRTAINALRERMRSPVASLTLVDGSMRDVPGRTQSPNQVLESREQQGHVLDILERHVASTDRDVLDLFYFQGKSIEEIAHMLEVPEGTVKRRLHTARRRFGQLFGGDHA